MDIQEFLHRDWYIQRFSARPNLFISGGIAATQGMKKKYGVSYGHLMVAHHKNFSEAYFDKKALTQLGQFIIERYNHDKKCITSLRNKSTAIFKKVRALFKKTKSTSASLKKLVKTYHQYEKLWIEYWSWAHIIEGFTTSTDVKIKELLQQQLESRESINQYYEMLTAQTKESFLNREYKDLLAIKRIMVSKKLTETSPILQKRLKQHAQEYHWIANAYHKSQILTPDYFLKELKTIDVLTIQKGSKNMFKNARKKKKALIKKLNLSKNLITLLKITEHMLYWQDVRKEETLQMLYYLETTLKELAARLKVDPEHLRWLAHNEVHEHGFDTQLVNERIKGCVSLHTETGYRILAGKEFTEFMQQLKHDDTTPQQITGITGALGRAIGRVKVCMNASQLTKVEKGDILVTSMTRPEFVPALKKVSGVITDEGGITCHAAIVCRELRIPCLIGTKHATKVLKDGMLVELKANHSVVRIVEEK